MLNIDPDRGGQMFIVDTVLLWLLAIVGIANFGAIIFVRQAKLPTRIMYALVGLISLILSGCGFYTQRM